MAASGLKSSLNGGFLPTQVTSESESLVLATSPLSFRLKTCGCSPYVTSCLTRGWVCRLQLLLVLVSAVIITSESRGTHDHILLSQIRDSPNLEGQVPVLISPRNRVAQLYPLGTGFHFHRLLRLAGLRWRLFEPTLTRVMNTTHL
jgi:hypothetical protein